MIIHLLDIERKTSVASSVHHNEIRRGTRKQRDNAIIDLTNQLHEYFDQFHDDHERQM